MRAILIPLIFVLLGLGAVAAAIWDLYAIWIGFAGGRLWPLGWEFEGGFWSGFLFALLGLPALYAVVCLAVAAVTYPAAWWADRRRR